MKNTGKKSIFVDSNVYLEDLGSDNQLFSNGTLTDDPLRYFSGDFWTKKENKIVPVDKTSSRHTIKINQLNDDTLILEANKTHFTDMIINSKGLLEKKFNKDRWEEYTRQQFDSIYEKNYEDYYFEIPQLTSIKKFGQENQTALNYCKKEFIYNFYAPTYEEVAADKNTDSNILPSAIALYSDNELGTRTFEENLLLSLGGLIQTNYVDGLYMARNINENVKQYFDSYANIYSNASSFEALKAIKKYSEYQQINSNKLDYLRRANFIPFPMYVDAKFTNFVNDISDFYHQLDQFGGVKSDLNKFLIDRETDSSSNIYRNFIYSDDFIKNTSIKSHDIKDWINMGLNSKFISISTNSPAEYPRSYSTITPIEYANLVEYMKKHIKIKKREYTNLMKDTCYTEILFYKIEKRLFNKNKSKPIQVFYIHGDNAEYIRFIDSQIKYGTEYFYTVKAFMLVIGNKYTYDRYDYSKDKHLYKKDIENGFFRVKFKNNATYKIFEVPYAEFSGTVHEAPVTKPQVKIEKNVDLIKISLLDSAQEDYGMINIISQEDFKTLESVKKSQERDDDDKIFSYRNKNDKIILQIYKTSERPQNYLNFQGKLYKTVEVSNNFTFNDSIPSNIKTYYCFRFLNSHGVPSDLSKVYEVELKNEEDYKYLNINEVDVHEKAEKSTFKNLKRYLLIRPSTLQSRPNFPFGVKNIYDMVLGPNKESVWNKDFILRITSKKTNRVLEFDLKSIIKRKKD